jgi:hypothetical protein
MDNAGTKYTFKFNDEAAGVICKLDVIVVLYSQIKKRLLFIALCSSFSLISDF